MKAQCGQGPSLPHAQAPSQFIQLNVKSVAKGIMLVRTIWTVTAYLFPLGCKSGLQLAQLLTQLRHL